MQESTSRTQIERVLDVLNSAEKRRNECREMYEQSSRKTSEQKETMSNLDGKIEGIMTVLGLSGITVVRGRDGWKIA